MSADDTALDGDVVGGMLDEAYEQGRRDALASLPDDDAIVEAIRDVCWKATQFGETKDGDTYAYIVPKGAMHRLIGAAQSVGIPASFRTDQITPTRKK